MRHLSFALRSVALTSLVALMACGDDESNPTGDPPVDPPVQEQMTPAPGGMRKLTAGQFTASVRYLFGEGVIEELELPQDTSALGLDAIGAVEHAVSPQAVELYELTARRIGEVSINDPDARTRVMSCSPASAEDDGCYRQIAERFGRLVWRRTLDAAEIDLLAGVARAAAVEYEDPDQGVAALVSTLIQSPDFLYEIEIGDPNPDEPTKRNLRPTELASRMSFFMLGRTPDVALLDRAEAGGLADEEQIRQAATEMLGKPEARAALRSFYSEVFNLRTVLQIQKDPEKYPLFTDATRTAIAEETLLFLDDLVWSQDTDARSLFDADFTYVNEDNAWLYGLAVTGKTFQKITIDGRLGLLSKPSFLAKYGHPEYTSPTKRGLFVLTTLLCDSVPPPPEDVNPTFPPDDGTPKTMRQRLEAHQSESCAVCHGQTDPIGLALENFDTVGKWRDNDQGMPLDVTGQVPGIGEFEGIAGVAQRLREHEDAPICMARQLFRQSMGHLEVEGEEPALEAIDEAFQNSNYSIQSLLVEIAASPAFRLVNEPR
ncbi:MAG: DUF1592 domain-containing protein [Polyangiaceae bacterium]|nr:DUF1592 domain-containing protein [Polyangiaceae bacterium]